MRLKATIAAIALATLPTLGYASCSWEHKNTSASTCAEGQTYDAATGTCVTATTS
jgi:hypothetical protein